MAAIELAGAIKTLDPTYNVPPHNFIEREGVIRSIVLDDINTAQAVAEASRRFEESPADAESDASN
jgi:hypothetical protein